MTIHQASQQLRFQLFHLYDEREAGNITDLVMENITGWKKIDRVVKKTISITDQQKQLLEKYTSVLLNHTPLQYVLNEAWFCGMKLYVDENVLIPRPETEELVDWLIKDARNFIPNLPEEIRNSVIDIGTGSGCIPLAIKKNCPHVEVHSCDVSKGALNVAKKNGTDLQLNIHFHLLDILAETDRNKLPVFDIIISNPPYIPHRDKAAMSGNVLQYEPPLALFVQDSDPLLFYKAIADFAKLHLGKNGSIYLEIHEQMGEAVINLYKEKGFSNIELRKDLQGRDRMIKAEGLKTWVC